MIDYEEELSQIYQEIMSEIFEDCESHARSEEIGWYYPESEGSDEDNLIDDNAIVDYVESATIIAFPKRG